MQLKNIGEINFKTLAKSKYAILAGHKPWKNYKNGVAGETIGTTFILALFANSFETIDVKVKGKLEFPMTNEDISSANAAGKFIYCNPVNFAAKLYQSDNGAGITCTADDIQLVKASNAGSTGTH